MEETKYKQTEIGLIPEEWECRSIGEITEVSAGGTPSTKIPQYWGGSISWMNSGELNLKRVDRVEGRITEQGLHNSSTHLIPPYCVLVGLAGQGKTRGTAAYNTFSLCTNQSIAAIHPSNVFNSIFAYYYFDSIYKELRALSEGGGGRGGLTKQLLQKIILPLPPLPEQHAIASALTSVDNLIASLDKQIAKTQNVKQGAMQQLIMGLNTEDVTWKPLGDVVNFSDGFPFDSSSFRSSGKYAVIRISDLSNYNVVRGDKYIEYLPAKIKDAQILGGGEILIAMSGSTGKVGYNKGSNFVVNQRIAIIRNKDNVLRDYLKHILLNSKFEENCFKQGTGIQNNIGKDVILDYLIPYPSIETQHRIASALTAIDDQISALEAKRRKYEMVKVGMMQQLLTGKIRLK